jgi:hypothetical protein
MITPPNLTVASMSSYKIVKPIATRPPKHSSIQHSNLARHDYTPNHDSLFSPPKTSHTQEEARTNLPTLEFFEKDLNLKSGFSQPRPSTPGAPSSERKYLSKALQERALHSARTEANSPNNQESNFQFLGPHPFTNDTDSDLLRSRSGVDSSFETNQNLIKSYTSADATIKRKITSRLVKEALDRSNATSSNSSQVLHGNSSSVNSTSLPINTNIPRVLSVQSSSQRKGQSYARITPHGEVAPDNYLKIPHKSEEVSLLNINADSPRSTSSSIVNPTLSEKIDTIFNGLFTTDNSLTSVTTPQFEGKSNSGMGAYRSRTNWTTEGEFNRLVVVGSKLPLVNYDEMQQLLQDEDNKKGSIKNLSSQSSAALNGIHTIHPLSAHQQAVQNFGQAQNALRSGAGSSIDSNYPKAKALASNQLTPQAKMIVSVVDSKYANYPPQSKLLTREGLALDETISAQLSPDKFSPRNSDHYQHLPKPLSAFKLGSGNLPPTQNSLNNETPRARKRPPQLIRQPQEGEPKATPHSPQNLEKNSCWYTSLSSAYQNFLAFCKVFKEDCVEAFTFNKKSAGTKTEAREGPSTSMTAKFCQALTSMVPDRFKSTSNSKTSETKPLLSEENKREANTGRS